MRMKRSMRKQAGSIFMETCSDSLLIPSKWLDLRPVTAQETRRCSSYLAGIHIFLTKSEFDSYDCLSIKMCPQLYLCVSNLS